MGALKVFQKICELDSDTLNVRQEISWLSQKPDALNTSKIKDILMNSRVNDVMLQQGQIIMDLSDFCTLACERYVNSFAIDTTYLAFLGEEKQSGAAYLPCYSQSWAKQLTRSLVFQPKGIMIFQSLLSRCSKYYPDSNSHPV